MKVHRVKYSGGESPLGTIVELDNMCVFVSADGGSKCWINNNTDIRILKADLKHHYGPSLVFILETYSP